MSKSLRGSDKQHNSVADLSPPLHDPASDLEDIAISLERWAAIVRDQGILADEDGAAHVAISALVVEGRALMEECLGRSSAFAQGLDHVLIGSGGYPRNSNANLLARYVLSIHGAVRQIRRKAEISSSAVISQHTIYVDLDLITQLQAVENGYFDFTRLAELCRELNVAAAGHAYMAITMLVRAVLDHVPPVLGCTSFAEVASSYPGSKSFKDHMRHLDLSSRKVADGFLHTRIRRRESLPTQVEVDFRSSIGELIREILRVALQKTISCA